MSDLITGKEAFNYVCDGKKVLFFEDGKWQSLNKYIENFSALDFMDTEIKFKLAPDTITLNGVDIAKPKQVDLDGCEVVVVLESYTDAKLLCKLLKGESE